MQQGLWGIRHLKYAFNCAQIKRSCHLFTYSYQWRLLFKLNVVLVQKNEYWISHNSFNLEVSKQEVVVSVKWGFKTLLHTNLIKQSAAHNLSFSLTVSFWENPCYFKANCSLIFSPSLAFPFLPVTIPFPPTPWKNPWHPSLSIPCGSWMYLLVVRASYRLGWPEGEPNTRLLITSTLLGVFPLLCPTEQLWPQYLCSTKKGSFSLSCIQLLMGFKSIMWTAGFWLILNVKFSNWEVLFHEGNLSLEGEEGKTTHSTRI